ncbi:IS21 family transposase [Cellulomonas sp. APG4]|uniref:IS21 family transposase n=1 Tax=Cellulomonas sp. APG4 TaxID=1538656 RepID=UPI00351B5179
MMTVEDWAEIRRLHRVEGMAIKAIGRRMGVSRNAVRRALARDAPPKYERASKGSIVDAVEPAVRELLQSHPRMPATVVAERIGWDRSLTVLKDRVRELRPYYLPPDPATRTAYDPGARVQCDLWFPPAPVPIGFGQVGSPPVLVMVSGYSRMIFARMLPTRQGRDLIAGRWELLRAMGGVPAQLVWDNEAAVGSWRAGQPRLTEEFEAFRGTLGISVHQCRPRDPEAKGLVERANGYLETSFLPGRTFTGPGDFNTQLTEWLTRANARHHRALGARPVDRWSADLAAMLPLPPVAPQLGWSATVRLPRDHYVRLDSNDYSVDPVAVGRKVIVAADLEQVTVRLGSKVVAAHERCWARQQTITEPAHRAAARALAHAAAHQPPTTPVEVVEQRDLSTYDAVFGLTEVA